jgi:hypothetical protein
MDPNLSFMFTFKCGVNRYYRYGIWVSWSWDCLQKLTVRPATQAIPRLLWHKMFTAVFTTPRHRSVFWATWIHSTPKFHFNIILKSRPLNSSLQASQPKCRSLTPPSCISSSLRVQITELLIKQEPGSSGSIVSDYGLDDRGSIPGRGKGFFL